MDNRSVATKAVLVDPIGKLKSFRGYTYTDNRPGFNLPGIDYVSQELQTAYPQFVENALFETNADGSPFLWYNPMMPQVIQQEALLNVVGRVENLEKGTPSTLQTIGTSTSLTNATLTNLASVTLTPGTWSVQGTVLCTASALAVFGSTFAYLEVTGETAPWYAYWRDSATLAAGAVRSTAVPSRYLTVAANTVVTLRLNTAFTLGTATGQGFVQAIKVG